MIVLELLGEGDLLEYLLKQHSNECGCRYVLMLGQLVGHISARINYMYVASIH